MLKRPWFRTGALAVAVALLLTACGGAASSPGGQSVGAAKKVKLGLGAPLTGSSGEDGNLIKNAVVLALEHRKDDAKLKDYQIELVAEDDKADPKEGAAIANKFAGDSAIFGYIGDYNSSVTLAAAPILQRAGISQISPGSSSPKITGFSEFLFRTQPTDRTSGENLVNWAQELSIKKVAVIYENTDYGKGLQNVYEGNWPKTGGQIVTTESYLSGQTSDFTAIMTKVKNAGAEAILLGSLYNESAAMAKQAKQLGMNIQFFGSDSMYGPGLIDLGKEAVEGFRVVSGMNPGSTDPASKKFADGFKAKFNKEPNSFAGQAYDAANIFLDALAAAGPDRVKINKYIHDLKDFPGVTGKTTFVKGDADKTLYRFQVQSGKFVNVQK
ncbi:MAG: putative high-affinity branched-chain amino acid transporter, amino acid-binding protein [Firmicutes bacterium]|nr:putative high-affinity branched-chain amino acid transporter, amino acid-binding protein [Bacillota bacterium]